MHYIKGNTRDITEWDEVPHPRVVTSNMTIYL